MASGSLAILLSVTVCPIVWKFVTSAALSLLKCKLSGKNAAARRLPLECTSNHFREKRSYMGRFARSQDAVISAGNARSTTIPNFSSEPEIKSKAVKSKALKTGERRAKGMKYFWIVLVSIIGLSAGWMLGQTWISSAQTPTQIAATETSAPAEDAIESKQSSEESAIPSASSDQEAQSVEQENQASDYHDRRPNKARRNVAVARAPRARVQQGPVTMMLKPFKAINPLKLRKLSPW